METHERGSYEQALLRLLKRKRWSGQDIIRLMVGIIIASPNDRLVASSGFGILNEQIRTLIQQAYADIRRSDRWTALCEPAIGMITSLAQDI